MTELTWHRASGCGGGECVEVAFTGDEYLIRQSDVPDLVLGFTPAEFLDGAERGEFDFE